MALNVYFIPSVVKSMYAEEDSALYCVNPFEESLHEVTNYDSSISLSDTHITPYDIKSSCVEIPERKFDSRFDSEFCSPNSPSAGFLSLNSCDSGFDFNEQVVDFSDATFCLLQMRGESSGLLEHSSEHTSKWHLASAFCNEQSPSRSCLDADRQSKGRSYTCQQCGKSFRRNRYLKKHSHIHSDAENFSCEICKKKFRLKSELKNHMFIHSVKDPHECPQCGKLYKTKRLLYYHLRVHTSKESFACKLCNKMFRSKKHLEEHVVYHSEVNFHLNQTQLQERSFHYQEEHNKENETMELVNLKNPNISGNDAGKCATSLNFYGVFPQTLSSNCLNPDGSMTVDVGSPLHVVPASSEFDMSLPFDAHTTTPDFHDEWSVNGDWYESILSPLLCKEVNRTNDDNNGMLSDHLLTSL